jgi:NADPH:quinone reductase-like Zn-dependent oxidoreductase
MGADVAIDGRTDDVAAAAREFAGGGGIDAALVLVNGHGLKEALSTMKRGGKAAHPNGVEPVPEVPDGVKRLAYDGTPGRDVFERLNTLIGSAPFHVELGRVYRLDEAERAHREIDQHHLGKLALRLRAA